MAYSRGPICLLAPMKIVLFILITGVCLCDCVAIADSASTNDEGLIESDEVLRQAASKGLNGQHLEINGWTAPVRLLLPVATSLLDEHTDGRNQKSYSTAIVCPDSAKTTLTLTNRTLSLKCSIERPTRCRR